MVRATRVKKGSAAAKRISSRGGSATPQEDKEKEVREARQNIAALVTRESELRGRPLTRLETERLLRGRDQSLAITESQSQSVQLQQSFPDQGAREQAESQIGQQRLTPASRSSLVGGGGGGSTIKQQINQTVAPTLLETQRQQSFPSDIRSSSTRTSDKDFFIREGTGIAATSLDQRGKIKDVNVGGTIRTGFRGFVSGIESINTSPAVQTLRSQRQRPPILVQSRESVLGSSTLGRGKAKSDTFLQTKVDPGQIGVELFVTPAFALQSSIPRLAQPRAIFRQPSPKSFSVSKSASLLDETGALVTGATVRTTPAKFETRASPIGEFFGDFSTVQIAPRQTTTSKATGSLTSEGVLTGSALTRSTTGGRSGRTAVNVFEGTSKEIPVPKNRLFKPNQKLFETQRRDIKAGSVGRTKFIDPKPGTRTTRTSGVTLVEPLKGTSNVFKTFSTTTDISKSLRGGRISSSRGGSVVSSKQFKPETFGSGGGTSLKIDTPRPSQVAVGEQQFKSFTSGLTKNVPKPRIKPSGSLGSPPPPIRSGLIQTPKTTTTTTAFTQPVTQKTTTTQKIISSSKFKPLSSSASASSSGQFQGLGLATAQRSKFKLSNLFGSASGTSPKSRQVSGQASSTKQTQALGLGLRSAQRLKLASFTPSILTTGTPPRKPGKPRTPKRTRGIVPFVLGGSLDTGRSKRKFKGSSQFANVPSFQALAFNLRGTSSSRGKSGLQFSAIPRGFSFNKLFSNERKRKKK